MHRQLVLAAALVSGCYADGLTGVACSDDLRSVIGVVVRNKATGASERSFAHVQVRRAASLAVVDSVTALPSEPGKPSLDDVAAYIGFEDRLRAGSYLVIVTKTGFEPFMTRVTLRMEGDGCHVRPAEPIVASLKPVTQGPPPD